MKPTPAALAAALLLAVAAAPAAAAWPEKPIRFIVPFPAGGGNEIVARALAETMTKELGQQVLVEPKPGAGTVVGSEYVASRPPDGYTILMASLPHSVNPTLYPKLPYDPAKAFAPIALIGKFPNLVVVPPESPAKTMAEFIAHARANPGKLNYGSFGNGTSPHLTVELFKLLAKVDIVHVPYKGAAPALIDLMGGRLDVVFSTASGAGLHIRNGKLRILGVTAGTRSPSYPNVPTIAEAGIAGYEAQGWYGVLAPAGTPPDIIARLNAALKSAAGTETFRKRSEEDGLVVAVSTPEEMARHMKVEEDRWRPVVKAANLKPD